MLLTLVDLLIVALATNQVIEIWRHSELFRERRFQIQIMKEGFESQSSLSWLDRPIYWWCRLMLCNWCLSVWVGLLVAIAYLSAIAGTELAAIVIRATVLTFAISRLANLINDVLYQYCRTPKYDTMPAVGETNEPVPETTAPDHGTTGLFPATTHPALSEQMDLAAVDSVNVYTNKPHEESKKKKPGTGYTGNFSG